MKKQTQKKTYKKTTKNQWKIYNYTKKKLFETFIYVFLVEFQQIICDLVADLIWPCLHAALVSLSIYPSSRSSGDVIAMFARALNEFVELS